MTETAASSLTKRADSAAVNFLASLGPVGSDNDREMIRNAYTVGWIQGAYAGANEARLDTCKRRPLRRSTPCHAKGTLAWPK